MSEDQLWIALCHSEIFQSCRKVMNLFCGIASQFADLLNGYRLPRKIIQSRSSRHESADCPANRNASAAGKCGNISKATNQRRCNIIKSAKFIAKSPHRPGARDVV